MLCLAALDMRPGQPLTVCWGRYDYCFYTTWLGMAHAMPDATELTRQQMDTPGDALLKVLVHCCDGHLGEAHSGSNMGSCCRAMQRCRSCHGGGGTRGRTSSSTTHIQVGMPLGTSSPGAQRVTGCNCARPGVCRPAACHQMHA